MATSSILLHLAQRKAPEELTTCVDRLEFFGADCHHHQHHCQCRHHGTMVPARFCDPRPCHSGRGSLHLEGGPDWPTFENLSWDESLTMTTNHRHDLPVCTHIYLSHPIISARAAFACAYLSLFRIHTAKVYLLRHQKNDSKAKVQQKDFSKMLL
jgi:hypothetical protein